MHCPRPRPQDLGICPMMAQGPSKGNERFPYVQLVIYGTYFNLIKGFDGQSFDVLSWSLLSASRSSILTGALAASVRCLSLSFSLGASCTETASD